MRKKSYSGSGEPLKITRQTSFQRVNQKEGSPKYVYLHSEDDQSEGEEEIYPLKVRKNPSEPRKVEVIIVQVQTDDTLQALALKYRCTVSELKRINKIHNDNEIHARQSIKVPVQPFSLLTETVGKNIPNNGMELNSTVLNTNVELKPDNKIMNSSSLPSVSTSSAVEINKIIFNSILEPSVPLSNESFHFSEDTETDTLIESTDNINHRTSNNIINTFKCSGADWGLSWFQLLCFSLLLGFAGPIFYILYIAENSSKHHHETSTPESL
ncbi:hypothetical protein TKK_0008639 [Trichogramma kaykai]|uniref:LysM domain-containing protein n=1 Tax=Trichogramma kaykai TaxID=54128 RepID=A0ABD2X478_9HYME